MPAHGEITSLLELAVKISKRHVQRAGLGELLAEQADRVRVWRRRAKVKAEKAQPTQAIPDQILHPCVADIVLRRQDQHLEHRYRVVRRTTALRPIRLSQ